MKLIDWLNVIMNSLVFYLRRMLASCGVKWAYSALLQCNSAVFIATTCLPSWHADSADWSKGKRARRAGVYLSDQSDGLRMCAVNCAISC